MGLASALTTALTGMQAAETQIDVVGNNLANSQTVGFKASEAVFATQFLQTQSLGSGPTATDGGTNPRQTGLGTRVAAITPISRKARSKSAATRPIWPFRATASSWCRTRRRATLHPQRPVQNQRQQRAGQPAGERVLGYGVDSNYQIQRTTLSR